VSHNMHAVEKLCGRVMRLECGRVAGIYEDVREGITSYLRTDEEPGTSNVWINRGAGGDCDNDYFVPTRLEVTSAAGSRGDSFPNWDPIEITVTGTVRQADPALNIGVSVHSEDGEALFWSFTTDAAEELWPRFSTGPVRLRTTIPAHVLNEGNYRVEVIADLRDRHWLINPGIGGAGPAFFSIRGGLSKSPLWNRKRPGLLAPVLIWQNCDVPVSLEQKLSAADSS